MTREEIIKLAAEAGFKWPDICETTIEQRLERFANMVAATEREKRTGTQEFVTLPREVVEQALAAMSLALSDVDWRKDSPTQPVIHKAYNATRAALDQPKNHFPDAGNMAPASLKLVPVEPTREMLAAACRDGVELNGRPVWKHTVDVQAAWRWGQMLAAAPQPPNIK